MDIPVKDRCGRVRDRAAGTGFRQSAPFAVFSGCAAAGYRASQFSHLYRFAHGGPAGCR
ncbi:MAG: hypothetical protein WCE46_06415 [Methanoregula sp.]|uniref:hypothetical protein n=1 Tax=Methanoregula sp. TaxID=2052170 RepID=UPI003C775A87